MQILHLAHHHQYHIIKLKIILIILICLLCTGCSQDKVNINKIDIKSVEITDVIEIEYINNTDICLNYEYYFAQFKKIVALSNLIQRIYHNDIRNMLP